jgi:alpha-L-rhamnosidase
MAADGEYELFLNGIRQGKGTSVAMPDTLDVTTTVKPGLNTLAVAATGGGPAKKPAGFIGAVRVEFTSGEPVLVETSAAWKVSAQKAADWTSAGFGDAKWASAAELGAYGMKPWGEAGFAEEHVLPARMLRKEFEAKPGLRRAVVYVSGLGTSELYLNGIKVSDHVLSPGLTDYDKRVFYVTHDVTGLVQAGTKNAIGVMLGNGRYYGPRAGVPIGGRSYGTPRLLLRLELEYADGAKEAVMSDETWSATTKGPIRANNEYDGEEYDARMEMPGWDKPGFTGQGWEPAQIVPAPKGAIVAQMAEPLRVVETRKPVSVQRLAPNRYIFDMGQNMVGWVRVKATGPTGTRIMLRHSETLVPDGRLYMDNLRSARVTDFFTLKGSGQEVYEPRFTYHGFRYVEVTDYPGEPKVDAIEGRVVHDDMARAGEWTSSDPLLNQLQKNIFWGIRGNYRSIPTDCPQRDERQGWLGDRSVVSRSESYLFDVAAFYSKWVTDIADAQRPDGSIPDVAPAYWTLYSNNMTWPGTFVLAPAMLYDQYGDVRVIERHYLAMRKWLELMRTKFGKDGIITKDTYGDWCVPPESPELIHSNDPARKTDGSLLSTAYYIQILKLMSKYAALVGRKQDVAEYEALSAQMRASFDKQFFNPDKLQYGNGTQTSTILPLAFGIAAKENRGALVKHLVEKIRTESNNHVGVGLVGAQWLMRTLSDNGEADLAYTIATQASYPGWGYMVEKGATTVWELWNGDTADPAMNSGNHVMQIGDLNVWFYEYLAGIRPDPEKPAFKHVIIRPYPVSGLQFVKATHKSMYGTIASEWKREGGTLTMNVTIPPNTAGTVYVPGAAQDRVTVTGEGARYIRQAGSDAVYEIASGSYVFTAR